MSIHLLRSLVVRYCPFDGNIEQLSAIELLAIIEARLIKTDLPMP